MPTSFDNDCPVCGQPIPERPRGSRHGHPPKTCSEACRKIRAAQRERDRYQRVKGTQDFKDTRAAYIVKIKKRLADDPEFAAIFRADSAAKTRTWRAKILRADPARHEELKAVARAERKAWRKRLESDPAAWEAHKARCRAWYASLTAEERGRIYYAPRRKSMT